METSVIKTESTYFVIHGSATVEVIINYEKKTADISPPYNTLNTSHGGKFRFSGNQFDLWKDVSGAIQDAVGLIQKELQ